MKLLLFFCCFCFFSLSRVAEIRAQTVKRQTVDMTACSDSDKEYMRGADGEELFYADFEQKKGVGLYPPFADPISHPGGYEFAEADMAVCQHNLNLWKKDFQNLSVPQDPPQTSIYSRDDVQMDSANTLICHYTRFFPPSVTVRWTKNNVDITKQSRVSQYYPNRDGTFNQFSHLPFTPQEGDIYTCTVQHKALDTPDTKTWEVDIEVPSVGPAVFCGVGLFVGLLGVATGTFFLVKGNQCN